jgi:hypothetical protein
LPLWADNPGLGMLRELSKGVYRDWQGHTDFVSILVPTRIPERIPHYFAKYY